MAESTKNGLDKLNLRDEFSGGPGDAWDVEKLASQVGFSPVFVGRRHASWSVAHRGKGPRLYVHWDWLACEAELETTQGTLVTLHASSTEDIRALLGHLADAPNCPRCGARMVPRGSTKPRRLSQTRWGCSRWPRCKGTRRAGAKKTRGDAKRTHGGVK